MNKGGEWVEDSILEPTVMFFGLTNFSATFQTIMDKILRDWINIEEVASFIDYLIVETEEEERYDEIVEEVVKRLAENNLYINQKNVNRRLEK